MRHERYSYGFAAGVAVGTLGGLIGLGGAEFRLPLLITLFQFPALEAVILNKALSLVVVTSAFPFRSNTIPLDQTLAAWPIIVNLLAGSLIGAWVGAGLATRLPVRKLRRAIAFLLVGMAGILLASPSSGNSSFEVVGITQLLSGIVAGFVIGAISSFLGVAGGELLIPTLVLLFGVNIALAGSLSLLVSLPTMLVGFFRYSYDASFTVLRQHLPFVGIMALGSLAGTFIGGRLLGVVPHDILLPMLAGILVISAIKLSRSINQ